MGSVDVCLEDAAEAAAVDKSTGRSHSSALDEGRSALIFFVRRQVFTKHAMTYFLEI